jgi:dipeptidyl aminopeptidase/acylaminoacyl peptidase
MSPRRTPPVPAVLAAGLMLALSACERAATPANEGAAVPATPAPAASEVALIPRDALFGNPERANVQISPDGKYLSWIAPVDGVLNVWIAPANDVAKAKAVTDDKARGIRQYFWSHLPDTLLYLRDQGGDEDFHLYSVNLASGAKRDLTPFPKTRALVAGVSHLHPESVLVGMNDRDAKWHDLYRVDLASGNRTLVEKNDDDIAGYVVDPDFKVRYAQRSREDGGTDFLQPDGKGGWTVIESVPFEDYLSTQLGGITTDGKTLYLYESRGRDTTALYAIDTDSRKKTLVFEDARADVSNDLAHPDTGRIQAVASNYLREEWKPLDQSIAGDLQKIKSIGPGVASVSARTQDDRTWIVTYSAAEKPAEYYRYDRGDGGKLTRLFSSRPALEMAPLVPQWPQEIKSRDGRTLVSYLTLPKTADTNNDGKAEKPLPMVLLVHGGPWARDNYGYGGTNQWLANRGYAVLQVNYRGSTGFGKQFVNASEGEWAGKMHDDLIDGVEWAVKNGVTTKDNVAIMGGSYGGYATLVGMTFTPDAFKCGVDIVGPSNLVTLFNTFPAYWASFMEQWYRRVGDPRTEAGKQLLLERSPITHVAKIKKPLLIAQGANDPRVIQAESDQIVEAMQAKKIPVTYVLFPDEGHGFARPENSKAFNAVAEGFLGQCLGGRVQPIGDDFAGSSITVPTGADRVPGLADALKAHKQEVRK